MGTEKWAEHKIRFGDNKNQTLLDYTPWGFFNDTPLIWSMEL